MTINKISSINSPDLLRKIFFILFLFQSHFVSSQQIPKDRDNTYLFPGSNWLYNKDPSVQGWDAKKMAELKNFIIDSSNTTSMMVIYISFCRVKPLIQF